MAKIIYKVIVLLGVAFLLKASLGYAGDSRQISTEHFDKAEQKLRELVEEAGGELPIPSSPVQIGQNSYKPSELIHDFSAIAINKHGWLDDAGDNGLLTPVYVEGYDAAKNKHPIIAEYLFRREGYPNLQSINKWDDEITIGIGWQQWKASFSDVGEPEAIPEIGFDPWSQVNRDSYPLFEEQIKALIPEIERLTGLPVTFVDPDDPRELFDLGRDDFSAKLHARIRVVPTRLTHTRTQIPSHHADSIERYFLAGVPFTPFEFGQVDGYFLPDADNTIGFAACRIHPDIGEQLIRAMITECLARALGLPGLSDMKQDIALGRWNGQLAALIEQRTTNAGENVDKRSVALKTIRDLPESHALLDSLNTRNLEKDFSEYDKFMISLLYCPSVKPGMNVYEIEKFLQTNNECLLHAQKEK